MKKMIAVVSIILLSAVLAYASDYQYVSPETVRQWIETKKPVTIVDIQVKEEFDAHHLPGSVATYAYPVKSDADKAKLETAIKEAIAGGHPVVIVCPRGGGGAKRCYDQMRSQNVPESQLLILKKGMSGWPYKDLVESGH